MLYVNRQCMITIDLWTICGLRVREREGLEHVKAGYRDPFTSLVNLAGPRLGVTPMITCTSIEEHRDEEQVD